MKGLDNEMTLDDASITIVHANNAVYMQDGYEDITLSLSVAVEFAKFILDNVKPERDDEDKN